MDVIDEITLTGVRAFGRHGVYAEERERGLDRVLAVQGVSPQRLLAARLLASAAAENEPFWRLPLAEFHRGQLPSNFADLNNTGSAAYPAGASTAAGFLSHFVENYHQGWLHIDCSATYRKSAVEQWSAGATGLGVRTIANLLTAE